jgi:hypothetical protein
MFASELEARAEYDSLVGQKLKKGYLQVASEEAVTDGADQSCEALTKQEFWALIDTSRRGTEDAEEQTDKLQQLLEQLSEEAILDFHRYFHEAIRDGYRWDIWAAAYIINGGCGNDGFDYFLGWLIAQGQGYFQTTLADPNHAGSKVVPGDYVECESIWYAAQIAYEKKTGKSDFYERSANVPRELQGTPWDENKVDQLFPKLAKKFQAAV